MRNEKRFYLCALCGIKISPMDTRNTIKTTNGNLLEHALQILRALESPKGRAVVHFLLENNRASFLELAIHTGYDSDILEYQLEQLCALGLLRQHSSLMEGDWYEPDVAFLQRVCAVAAKLAAFHGA